MSLKENLILLTCPLFLMVSDSTAGYCFISLAPSKISSEENELIEESEVIRS